VMKAARTNIRREIGFGIATSSRTTEHALPRRSAAKAGTRFAFYVSRFTNHVPDCFQLNPRYSSATE
jgi:hypothetical protein